MKKQEQSASIWKSLRLGLIIFFVLIVFAYGFEVTKVDLKEFHKSSRQDSRIRVTRALARPEIFVFEQEEFIVLTPIYVPCPDQPLSPPSMDLSEPYMVVTPQCAAPGELVQVEGFKFQPNIKGPLSFIPSSDPNNSLALKQGDIFTDDQGHFSLTIKLPKRPGEDVQYLRATTRRNVGLPHLSQTAIDTWDKIVETVFLALLATTLGIIFSVPVSFVAARNIMKDVKSPLTSIALTLIGWPVGIYLGFLVAFWLNNFTDALMVNKLVGLISFLICLIGAVVLIRKVVIQAEIENLSTDKQIQKIMIQIGAALLAAMGLYLVARLGLQAGMVLVSVLGPVAFMGNFVTQLSDITAVVTPGTVAIIAGAVLGNVFGKIGQQLDDKLPFSTVKILNIFLSCLAGAIVLAILAGAINWLYEIRQAQYLLLIMAGIGATLGLALTLYARPKESLPIGLTIYYITRTFLNATRSIEALIMAIVAVIWVGIGPFAGVMALGLHSIVSLAKLYSEQVESIMPGPMEAITATGATRLQTIIYAVIPQIIPPYISFTMYRWDINVRMSTIIGFAGGGGIGFLLIQNINLLNYRAASTQMLAIAVVVSIMDYLSSSMRERYV